MIEASMPSWPTMRTPLVGRERELALLRAGLEMGLDGEGRVVLLTGEPGIGKTRTAEELAADAVARGALVCWGRCHEAEWTPPFWPWVQAFRAYAHHRPADALHVELGAGAADIAQLVPEVAARLPDLPVLPALAPEQARFRTFDHIAAFLRRAAMAQPLVLIFDDLHWADAPSLLLLEFVAREVLDAPIVVLGTYRDVEVGRQHPLVRTVGEVVRTGQSQRVGLQGLSKREVGQLVAASGVTATAELVTAVYEETAGNPFFVHEVARLLAGEAGDGDAVGAERTARRLPMPESVREAVGRRLDRLSPACNEVLTAAAAIGRQFGLPVLARVSGRTTEQVLEALEEAETARLIEEVPRRVGGYRFGHALIREALYEELSAVQKVRLHRQIGLALETLYGSDPEPHLAELAHHFVQAAPGGDAERAVAYARRAGERAMALLAFEDAAAHFDVALQVIDLLESPVEALQCDLMLVLAAAHLNAGDVAAGRAIYLRAANLAKAAGLPEQLARAALGFGGEAITAWGYDAELVRVLEDALDLLGSEDSPMRAQLLTRLAIEYSDVDAERFTTLARDAETIAWRLGEPRSLAFALIGRLHVQLEHYEGWEALIATGREMAQLGETIGDRGLTWSAACGRLCGQLLAGDVAEIDREIEACARIADDSRQPFFLFWTPTLRALRALVDGRFADAERHVAEAVALVPRAHLAHWVLWYAPNLFALRREQGKLAETETTLRDAIADTRDPERDVTYRAMLALAYFETGRHEEARREFEVFAVDDFASVRRRNHRDTNTVHGLGYLAEVCAALADAPRATTLYGLLAPYASHNLVYGGTWHVAGSASHYLGLLAATLDLWDDAARHFEDALAMNGRMGARPLVARTQLAYAQMLARRGADGDYARARSLTDAALATANELGMIRLGADVAMLGSTLESRSTEHGAAARFGLTEREIDVLRLLAAGRSNPEIAALLFISAATARTHVSNIFAKLDVHSRTEAVDYAHRHGLLLPSDLAAT